MTDATTATEGRAPDTGAAEVGAALTAVCSAQRVAG